MKRRDFIALVGTVAIAPNVAIAQTPGKVYRLALVSAGGASCRIRPLREAFARRTCEVWLCARRKSGLRGPAWDGRAASPASAPDGRIEGGQGRCHRRLWLSDGRRGQAGRDSHRRGVGIGDPVTTGLVANLARPDGNITGISDVATTLSTKRLGLLRELLPKLHRVAMLWNKDDLGMSLRYDASARAATEGWGSMCRR